MGTLLRLARRLLVGDPRRLAREAQARTRTPEQITLDRFRREFRASSKRGDFITFGFVPGPRGKRTAIGLPLSRIVGEKGTHILDQGPSRSGKTRLALAVLRQLQSMPVRAWTIDPKGDLTDGRERLLAAAVSKPGGERLLERLRVLRLFDPNAPPPVRLTAREEGIPITVQAAGIATALQEASGAELGHRMGHILHFPAELAIETNQPLTSVLDWLTRPSTFAAAAAASQNDRLRHFAHYELPRENKESLRALVVRLQRVLLLPSVRRAVEAPTCFNFREALDRFEVILDGSNPPPGEEAAVRMLCSPLLGRMTRAVLSRPVTTETMPVLIFIDELPELLGRFETDGIGRLVSLAGSRLTNFFLIHQERGQLGSELFHLLRTNCGIETVFRPSHRDAELIAHALPVPDGVERPSQVREGLVRAFTRLRRRRFLFWCKDGGVPAHFVTAPFIDLDPLPRPGVLRERLQAQALAESGPSPDFHELTSKNHLAKAEARLPFGMSPPKEDSETQDDSFPSLG